MHCVLTTSRFCITATAHFQIARAGQAGQDMCRDMLLSFACAADDPTSGGHHKVLDSCEPFDPPQMSTFANQLPQAVGAVFGLGWCGARGQRRRSYRMTGLHCQVCDVSLNHSTALGAINAAGWASVQGVPTHLLMICEDNGIGVSTKTPTGWMESSLRHRPGISYFQGDGLNYWDTYRPTSEAGEYVRTRRKPAVLHLRTVRLYGHAGADVAAKYLPKAEVEADEANDPLLCCAACLPTFGLTETEVAEINTNMLARVLAEGRDCSQVSSAYRCSFGDVGDWAACAGALQAKRPK